MRKFPRTSRITRSLPRTFVVGRRGSSTATETSTGIGDQTFYVASVPGGKADLEMVFVAGVAQSLTVVNGHSVESFTYAIGPAPSLSAGFGWNGDGAVMTPYLRTVGEETFDSYDLGAISGADLNQGTGWQGIPELTTPYARTVAEDTFESYAEGGISGGSLTAGTGWNGSAAVNSL